MKLSFRSAFTEKLAYQIEYISKETSRIKLNVVINQELLQLLASQSQALKVISPEKLKTAYKDFILQKVKDLDFLNFVNLLFKLKNSDFSKLGAMAKSK